MTTETPLPAKGYCRHGITDGCIVCVRAALEEARRERDEARRANPLAAQMAGEAGEIVRLRAERDALAVRLHIAREAMTRARDQAITEFGGKDNLRRCEICKHVQTGDGPFEHRTTFDAEMLAWKPKLEPACVVLDRALAEQPGAGTPVPTTCPTCGDQNCDSMLPWDPPPCPRASAPPAVPVPLGPPCSDVAEDCGIMGVHYPECAAYVEPAPATPIPAPPERDGHTTTCDAWNPGAPCDCGWAEISEARRADPKACESWCGVPNDGITEYCTVDCHVAGRPLHPAAAPCGRCGDSRRLFTGTWNGFVANYRPCPDCSSKPGSAT